MKPHRHVEVKSYLIPYQDLPRPVFWFNDELPAGTWSGIHRHSDWGELAYMKRGHMVMCVEDGSFLVPPNLAVWVPKGLEHEWYLPQDSVDCGLYIVPGSLPDLPRFNRVHAMEMSPLARELIHSLAGEGHEYADGPISRKVAVLLDEISQLPVVDAALAMPQDHRLVELCTMLLNEPDHSGTICEWCQQIGMSERTLARLFQKQTGESFGSWRRKLRLHHAMERLNAGESVTSVTMACGYHSVSSFIAVFKKVFGTTPGSFLREGEKEVHQ